jgi:hypothetical protein
MERRNFTRSQTDRITCAIYGALAIAAATLGGFLALYLAL